ncbi:monofunctional biosynthetic peptidoglycan transglycosylase [Parabacteroides chinchillae]|uniref:Biosynthetic peptidoglycan transglycosylase n=1 Tax=Parabacteroides chinchillae TaxID=871327 RepID=A0A8G2BYV4_9BACT|nr:monofunctional biosynthetic peptidoglycan transglycosylase [Parabacteroides chinchillae]SEG24696.1 monofunctional biosynthetic peptidoglycan transglycosylase [Parabacteroides chinchillae]
MRIVKRILIWCRNILIFLFLSSILAVVAYKYIPVYYTPLMFIRLYDQFHDGKKMKLDHKWVSLSEIAQPLVQAVVASEDNLFLDHHGFDIEQIQKARTDAEKGKRLRGASTISQQTAKNVFLWPGKTYIRKAIEAYFTVLIEWIWGKERIMEVYLNSIEMGDGIYGAEAVAQAHFHKKASKLTKGEAALIAASLPNPRKFNSGKPSPYMLKRQTKIMSLMGKLLKIEMGYGAGEQNIDTGKIKKRKKWRASSIMTWDAYPTLMH